MAKLESAGYWRIVIDPPLEGAANMAIDETLLDMCVSGERDGLFPVLRLYGWNVPTISIGYNQRFAEAVDREACRRERIACIRRQTGGKAVLHDRELTYSLIARFSDPPFTPVVADNYMVISEAIREGLAFIGISASIAGDDLPSYDPFSRGHCFSRLSRYELCCGESKIVGSAQRRRKGAFLQHGSIILDSNRELLSRLTRSADSGEKNAFITVRDVLGREVAFQELAEAMVKGFEKRMGITFIRSALTERELSYAEELKMRKYLTAEWNISP